MREGQEGPFFHSIPLWTLQKIPRFFLPEHSGIALSQQGIFVRSHSKIPREFPGNSPAVDWEKYLGEISADPEGSEGSRQSLTLEKKGIIFLFLVGSIPGDPGGLSQPKHSTIPCFYSHGSLGIIFKRSQSVSCP